MGKIIFKLIMEQLCVVCAIERVTATLKPKILKFQTFWLSILKQLPFGTQCFIVPFSDNLILVGTLKMSERSLSLIFKFYFSHSLRFVIVN